MDLGARLGRWKEPSTVLPRARRAGVGRWLSNLLFVLGGLLLACALAYAAFSMLNTWIMGQDRYLRADEIAPLLVPTVTWTQSLPPTPGPSPTFTSTPASIASPGPTPTPAPPPAPVQIRIPALGVNRSIVKLARVRDRSSGAWTWNVKRLFRPGRSDLVGHWEGSAYPGQEGNMILVGHNYGYGYNGVFVRLGALKPGQPVYVVNETGQTFTYQVRTVSRVKWRQKSFGELTQHLSFLTPGGPERVTLVSCGGANVEPFPERVYVVADRVK